MMRFTVFKNTLLLLVLLGFSYGCKGKINSEPISEATLEQTSIKNDSIRQQDIVIGAARTGSYFGLIKGKKVGIVANQTTQYIEYGLPAKVIDGDPFKKIKYEAHLVDFLIAHEIDLVKVFAPEHGFRGRADAGETVKDGVDTRTGLPIVSLYGKNKKPTPEQLQGIEVMIFDIQDVGVRFYTYISTMHYAMEACAEAGIPFIVLDRPNPNGHYIDGPVMEPQHTSFLGLHPVPLVHGMTIGEYAQMINGEGWLANGIKCDLTVVPMQNYMHDTFYSVPVRPSPNLPNDVAINLYPSLGLLEGTNLNAGRGTEIQFQLIGSPFLPKEYYSYEYTPQPNFGAKYPKHKGAVCNGLDLRETPRMNRMDLTWILDAYRSHTNKEKFFNTKNFTAHAGTEILQQQIMQGYTHDEIRKTWMKPLEEYNAMRQQYLIYD